MGLFSSGRYVDSNLAPSFWKIEPERVTETTSFPIYHLAYSKAASLSLSLPLSTREWVRRTQRRGKFAIIICIYYGAKFSLISHISDAGALPPLQTLARHMIYMRIGKRPWNENPHTRATVGLLELFCICSVYICKIYVGRSKLVIYIPITLQNFAYHTAHELNVGCFFVAVQPVFNVDTWLTRCEREPCHFQFRF